MATKGTTEVTIKIEGDFAFDRKKEVLTQDFIRAYQIDLRGLIQNAAFTKFFNDFIMLNLEKLANCTEEETIYQRAKLKVARDILAALQDAAGRVPKIENKFVHKREVRPAKKQNVDNYEL